MVSDKINQKYEETLRNIKDLCIMCENLSYINLSSYSYDNLVELKKISDLCCCFNVSSKIKTYLSTKNREFIFKSISMLDSLSLDEQERLDMFLRHYKLCQFITLNSNLAKKYNVKEFLSIDILEELVNMGILKKYYCFTTSCNCESHCKDDCFLSEETYQLLKRNLKNNSSFESDYYAICNDCEDFFNIDTLNNLECYTIEYKLVKIV